MIKFKNIRKVESSDLVNERLSYINRNFILIENNIQFVQKIIIILKTDPL